MDAKKNTKNTGKKRQDLSTKLKVGDKVMVLCGGNKKKGKTLKSQVGKVLRFIPKRERVVVEGLNLIKRHKKAMTSRDTAGIIEKEGSVNISNVMYYSEQLKRPVRIKMKQLENGQKVRGYINPETKAFEQIDV